MSYTPPNTFVAGNLIESARIQENNDALRAYVNGGVQKSNVQGGWIQPKHIMKGVYFPLMNEYEMESCLSKGMPDYPIYHPGYYGQQIHDFGGSGRATIPTTSISFYLEQDATVFFYTTLSVRPLDVDGASSDSYMCVLSVSINGAIKNNSQGYFIQLKPISAAGDNIIMSPYRTAQWDYCLSFEATKGKNTIELVGQSGIVSVPLKFYNYTIQAYY